MRDKVGKKFLCLIYILYFYFMIILMKHTVQYMAMEAQTDKDVADRLDGMFEDAIVEDKGSYFKFTETDERVS